MSDSALTCAELARRYQVARSTVARALQRGRELHAADPGIPAPPGPVNPGQPQARYVATEMDTWWPHRSAPGRPRGT